jgi:serine/threonine-protein kinase
VLSQTPAAGTKVDPGSVVTLTVARQSKQVTVPDVTGRDQAAALTALSDAGLRASVSQQDVTARSDDGKVLAQDPGGGSKVNRNSTVTLTVGHFTATTTPTTPTSP